MELHSDRLRVSLALPGEAPNNGCRFDRAGFVTEVVLDGEIPFAASEPRNLWHPSTGGRGFCCEYKADLSGEAAPGAYFPKFGVGLFPRGAEPHRFYSRYDQVQPFPVQGSAGADWAEFVTEPLPCLGYALRTGKRISVSGNEMSMEITAENVGDKPIATVEYCHNFISIAGMALGPDYRIALPQLPDLGRAQQRDVQGNPCNWRADGHGFTFLEWRPDISHIPVDLSHLEELPFRWRLSHRGARASVTGFEECRPAGMEIWAADHIVSPEVFFLLELSPGEKKTWRRSWRFDSWTNEETEENL